MNINGDGIFAFHNMTKNENYSFEHEHTDFLYDFETAWYIHLLKTGMKARRFRYIVYYFDVSYQSYIGNPNTMKAKDLLNDFLKGDHIEMTPHSDVPQLRYRVYLQDGYASSLNSHLYGLGNKDFHLLLETDPLQAFDWMDPENVATFYLPVGRRTTRII